MTLEDTGIISALKDQTDFPVIVTSGPDLSPEQKIEARRRALACGLFVSSTNALTVHGQLVNLDGIGNRVAAMAFGPKTVVIIAGRNKITPSHGDDHGPGEKLRRTDEHSPVCGISTPCAKTGRCHDCNSPERICNVWSITEKSHPEGRIKVILVDEDLGY